MVMAAENNSAEYTCTTQPANNRCDQVSWDFIEKNCNRVRSSNVVTADGTTQATCPQAAVR